MIHRGPAIITSGGNSRTGRGFHGGAAFPMDLNVREKVFQKKIAEERPMFGEESKQFQATNKEEKKTGPRPSRSSFRKNFSSFLRPGHC